MKRKTALSLLLILTLLLSSSAAALAANPPAPEAGASPASAESDAWAADYLRLLTDASARNALIGSEADYRNGYFSYDPSALDYESWRLADLNGDGIPELLMTTAVGLTDLFTWRNGAADYLGYGDFFGFLPDTGGQAVVHGHWHGAGGSQRDEWSVSNPFLPYDERSVAFFDHLGTWSLWEGGFSINEDSAEAQAAYEDAVRRYVDPCVRLADLPSHPMEDPDGLAEPADLSAFPNVGALKASFPLDCSMFLLGYGWWGKADFCRNAEYPVLLLDFDGDGISELLIQNGYTGEEKAACVFCRRAGRSAFVPVGEVPTDLRFSSGFWELYGKNERDGESVWTSYSLSMSGSGLQSYEMTWMREDPAEPEFTAPAWTDMRELCEALCNPDPENAYRITVVSGADLVDFCPATASVGSTVPVLLMSVTDGDTTGGGAEGGEWRGSFYLFPMPDHDVELRFAFVSNGLA